MSKKSFLLLLFYAVTLYAHSRDPKFHQISVEEGLSNVSVNCILQDHEGFMWFGTENGLNRFDGYNFRIYKSDLLDSASISDNAILCLYQADSGAIWIGTRNGGLNRLDKASNKFYRYRHHPDTKNSLSNDCVQSISVDENGFLWIGTKRGLNRLDPSTQTIVHYYHPPGKHDSPVNDHILKIINDKKGSMWLGTNGGGLSQFEPELGKFTNYSLGSGSSSADIGYVINDIYMEDSRTLWLATKENGLCRFDIVSGQCHAYTYDPADPFSIASNSVNSIHREFTYRKNLIWLGTTGGGINVFNKQTNQFIRHKCDLNTLCCLGTNTIHTIFENRSGIIWVGTDCCGLNKYDDTYLKYVHYSEPSQGFETLQHEKTWDFLEDNSGFLWIATSHGLKRLNISSQQFTNFNYIYNDPKSLSNDAVTSIYQDIDNVLWVGTEDGLNKLDPMSTYFQRYKYDPHKPNSLSDNSIITIMEDRNKNLWIGTKFGGLNKLDPGRNQFSHYKYDPQNPNSIANTAVMTLIQSDPQWSDDLWIGTFNGGLLKFDSQKEIFKHYTHDPNNSRSLSNNTVNAIYEDTCGMLWIGTDGGGLNRFDRHTERFDQITVKDGLLDNIIHTIEADDQGHLWLGTSRGLSRFNIGSGNFKNFHFGNEPKTGEYMFSALYRNRYNQFYYGTSIGFITFDPDSLSESQPIPPVVITGLKLLNEDVSMTDYLSAKKTLELSYDQNFISFEFAVLDYLDPLANQYSYMLENVNVDWVYNQNLRSASYTDVRPGEYIFRVKGANSAGVWNEKGTMIKVVINPPFWQTWWAYSAYVLLFMMLLYSGQRMIVIRERRRNKEKINTLHRKKLQEINDMKSKFFTNISHEFRTPLSLILGPVEKMLNTVSDPQYQEDLSMVYRNTRRLHKLINQLLDLSKVETGHMQMEVRYIDLVSFLDSIVLGFSPLAESKNISLTIKADIKTLMLYFDPDKMEKIMSNLIANALKFTDQEEKVVVRIHKLDYKSEPEYDTPFVKISISDTGQGIPQESLPKIFDRFYQVNHLHDEENKGTGIGLSLAKELVDLHLGRIEVKSTPGKGTTFFVFLRLGKDHFRNIDIKDKEPLEKPNLSILSPAFSISETSDIDESKIETEKRLPKQTATIYAETVLIVEDNRDVQRFLSQLLEDHYSIICANNGKEGIDAAMTKMPDLIISDIIMPHTDGFKLCTKLKMDHRTSHIPIILLTAKATAEAKINGLEMGADDYITKPFDAEEVRVRIKNLIEQRKRLRKKFSLEPSLKIHEVVPTRIDAEFINRAIQIIDKHSENPKFDVQMFCREVGLSRVQLHRKIRALTDNSTTEFIRKYKVRKAAKLIAQNEGNVFEIAYRVGFNNLSYFAKCFREEFGMSPSAYKHQLLDSKK